MLVCVAALLMKLLVPAGYMVEADHGRLAITTCPGSAPVASAMPAMHHAKRDHAPREHGKAEMPCVFAGLSAAALGTADPVQLAALIAFVLALGLAATILPAPSRPAHLRPPLRGPPARL